MGLLSTSLCHLYVIVLAFEASRCLFTRQNFFYDGFRPISAEQSRTVELRRPL